MRAPSVVVGSLLFVVGVVVGCGGGGSGDADDAPNDGGSGEGAGTETSNGGSTSTAPSCVEDGATASSQAACCSGEIDSGYCCSGETCCGPQNHSQRASNGACQCEPGYEWASPVETNLVCEENQCHPDGFNADSVFDCCSQKIDDFGQCCSAKGCCNASNHSHGSGSQCACDEGYMWASDDPADYSCVVPDDHVIACTSQGYAPQWCECTPQDDNLGEVALTGSCYPDQTFAPMTCCASNSYPEAGSCQCWMTQQWRCHAYSSSCYCNFWWESSDSEYYTSVCNNVPEPDGTPWRCCVSDSSCSCHLNGAACDANETEVANCVDNYDLGFFPFQGCQAGESTVSSCDGTGGGPGGSCNSDDDCGSGCSGDDPVCCPSCENGYCGQICCTSDGNCF